MQASKRQRKPRRETPLLLLDLVAVVTRLTLASRDHREPLRGNSTAKMIDTVLDQTPLRCDIIYMVYATQHTKYNFLAVG